MSYRIQIQDNTAYPIVVCDHCGERIEQASHGNATWLVDATDGFEAAAGGDIAHTHKTCDAAFVAAHPSPSGFKWRWNGLTTIFT